MDRETNGPLERFGREKVWQENSDCEMLSVWQSLQALIRFNPSDENLRRIKLGL